MELVGPSVDHGISVEFIHGGHEAVLEFLFGCDADVAQHGGGELGKEPLDEIEPGAVLGREGEFAYDRFQGIALLVSRRPACTCGPSAFDRS